jgi:N-acetylmuramoyl-L-alanine amidase
VQDGRPIEEIGAHVKGHNKDSIGICLVGGVSKDGRTEFNFTRWQIDSLERLLDVIKNEFPHAEVKGHRDFEGVTKACPSFDVIAWYGG